MFVDCRCRGFCSLSSGDSQGFEAVGLLKGFLYRFFCRLLEAECTLTGMVHVLNPKIPKPPNP